MIAVFSLTRHNHISGVNSWLIQLLRELRNRGEKVVVLLHRYDGGTDETEIMRECRQLNVIVETEYPPIFTEERVKSVLAFLRKHKPSVFLPQCLEEGYFAGLIAGRAGLPWIMTVHSDDPDYWAALEVTRPESHNGGVVAVSNQIAKLSRAKGLALHPQVIPYGVSIPAEKAHWDTTNFRIAFCGRIIEHQKRISLVFRAMVLAIHKDHRIQASVLGDGPQLELLREWVSNEGLSSRIKLFGKLSAEEVKATLAGSHAILLMSDFEGLPVALMEAMAAGVVPVVRRIRSGIPEIVHHRETGLLVSEDPEQAAEAVCELAKNEALWTACSLNAQRLIDSTYSEDICFAKWKALIRNHQLDRKSAGELGIPSSGRLPRVHPDLRGRDVRKPTLISRFKSRLYRITIIIRSRVGQMAKRNL